MDSGLALEYILACFFLLKAMRACEVPLQKSAIGPAGRELKSYPSLPNLLLLFPSEGSLTCSSRKASGLETPRGERAAGLARLQTAEL
jgi:hypothetical protein